MKRFLFATDLDHTLVGDPKALKKLNSVLEASRANYDTKVVYVTGRSLTLFKELSDAENLIEPDALITSVGTEIYFDVNNPVTDREWDEQHESGWDRETIVKATEVYEALVPQAQSEQRPFKVSFLLKEADAIEVLPALKEDLEKEGLNLNYIYSSGKDLDILPLSANKGTAIQYLRIKWGFSKDNTVVCGDSGNDIALFAHEDVNGIIVANAKPELLQWKNENLRDNLYLADSKYSNGILEGLDYFSFI